MILAIGDIFDFIRNGMSIKQSIEIDGLPITRIETIWNSEIDLSRVGYAGVQLANAKDYLLKDGDILFSHINSVAHIGKCALYSQSHGELVHGMNLLCFRPNQTKILPKYALYALRSNQFKDQLARGIKKAVNQASVTISDIKKIEIEIPSLAEQQRIAAILYQAELIKSKRELAVEKLDELAQSIFVDMFGDLVTNPKNFDVIELSEICDLQNGFAFKSDDYIDSSNILNCRMSNIRPNGEFDILYHPKYLPNHYADKYSSFLLNDGDVIIAMTDMAGEPKILGVPTIVNTQGYKLLLNQRVGKLIFKNQQPLSIKYLKYALSQPYVKQYYRKFASGGVQINLGKKDLLSVKILLPSYAEQKVFDSLIGKLFTEKEKHVKANQKIDMISQSIKSIAFSGKL